MGYSQKGMVRKIHLNMGIHNMIADSHGMNASMYHVSTLARMVIKKTGGDKSIMLWGAIGTKWDI